MPFYRHLAAGGGGVSTLSASHLADRYGRPNDGQRDVPDISLSSSPGHDGYIICSQGSCVNGFRQSDQTLNVIGGTRRLAGVFRRGCLDEPAVGLAWETLIQICTRLRPARRLPFTTSPPATTWFPASRVKGLRREGTIGYSAAAGYDLASGLGSVDIGALVAAWNGGMSADFTLSANPTSLALVGWQRELRHHGDRNRHAVGGCQPDLHRLRLTWRDNLLP